MPTGVLHRATGQIDPIPGAGDVTTDAGVAADAAAGPFDAMVGPGAVAAPGTDAARADPRAGRTVIQPRQPPIDPEGADHAPERVVGLGDVEEDVLLRFDSGRGRRRDRADLPTIGYRQRRRGFVVEGARAGPREGLEDRRVAVRAVSSIVNHFSNGLPAGSSGRW